MTCQWCTNFRRKNGMPACTRPGGDGKTISSKGGVTSACGCFSPRKNCTTCEFRCSPDERASLMSGRPVCIKWALRSLGTWGGSRYRGAAKSSSGPEAQSAGKKNEKEKTV